jgi:flagellar L-ring protein FlgH
MRFITQVIVLGIVFGTGSVYADSLFSKRSADRGTLISDKKSRFEVGDLVTVMVRESINAEAESDLDTKKESTLDANSSNPFLTGKGENGLNIVDPGSLPNWNMETENEHKSDGSTSRGSKLTMTITCMVKSVNNNGTIEISGEKLITVNREKTMLTVAGTVRSRDVASDNTLTSNQIANAEIQLTGEGPLWNNQRRGFFTKALDWFSPF